MPISRIDSDVAALSSGAPAIGGIRRASGCTSKASTLWVSMARSPAGTRYDEPLAHALMINQNNEITGLVLAGGRGSRMGGVDKGLQPHLGVPLAQHCAQPPAAPGCGADAECKSQPRILCGHGCGRLADEMPDFPGPLAGMLAGLEHCSTAYLATVPCDSPNFPHDLVERLAAKLASCDGDMATAYTREGAELRAQPVFCLMKTSLRDALRDFLQSGERKTGLFAAQRHGAKVMFDDAAAFANANTPSELATLQINPRSP